MQFIAIEIAAHGTDPVVLDLMAGRKNLVDTLHPAGFP